MVLSVSDRERTYRFKSDKVAKKSAGAPLKRMEL